ncbi:MAG: transglycosylase SLT domain-containing protein [Bacteroidota bacterium]
MKRILLLGGILMFIFSGTLSAQEEERQKIVMPKMKSLEITGINEGFFEVAPAGSYSGNYQPGAGFEQPDENLDDFLSEKMDSLVDTWYAKQAFHEDSLGDAAQRYPKNLPDSVYIKRLQDMQEVVDLSYNNVVRNFIVLYTEKRRDQVEMMLGLAEYYFPMFEQTLDKYEMPLDLKYLPVIESALNPTARSRVGATGLWQFMFGTARQMGLEITSFVDERRDPVASTDAAVRYFQSLYNRYGNWHLAIAAYNCGPGNVNRAIRRAGGTKNYWEIYYRLPRETRGYVPAYIAAAYVMKYHKEHNLYPRLPDFELLTDTVMVNDFLHFDQLAATLEIDKAHLRSLNPMYRRDVVPAKKDKPLPVVLPNETIMDFIDTENEVFAHEREKFFPDNQLVEPTSQSASYYTPADIEGKAKVLYTVQSGDNVGFISEWFNVRASDLRYWNNISRNLIRAGQKLLIYVPEDQKERYERINSMTFAQKQASVGKQIPGGSSKATEQEPIDPDFIYHTVRRGDTLWEIARNYPGITSDDIVRLNNLRNENDLDIGQKLKIKRKS